MRIIIRVFAAHSAVGTLFFLAAGSAKAAVLAGVFFAYVKAYLFTFGAKLALIQTMFTADRAGLICTIAAYWAAWRAAAAASAITANILFTLRIGFAAL